MARDERVLFALGLANALFYLTTHGLARVTDFYLWHPCDMSALNKPFTITADIEVPDGGGNGMLVTQGGRFGGWGFYLLKGKPVFVYDLLDLARPRVEASAPLMPGKHKVEFAFKPDGPGLGKGGTGTITVDGVEVGRGNFPHTVPFALESSETFDIGSDTGTGVNDADYHPLNQR